MPDRAPVFAGALRHAGKFGGQRPGQHFVHVEAGSGGVAHGGLQPGQPGARLADRRRIARHGAMAGDQRDEAGFAGQCFELVERLQPVRDVGVRRGRGAAVEDQVAGEQNAAFFVVDRQIGAGVAVQRDQAQAAAGDVERPGAQAARRHDNLGAAHPVAAQAEQVLGKGVAVGGDALRGGGQGGERQVGKSLVAEEMVGVMVGVDGEDGRQRRDGGNRLAHLAAVAQRGPGIDDDDTGRPDDESGIDDIAAVDRIEILGPADEGVHVRRHGLRLERVVVAGGAGGRHGKDQEGGEQAFHGAMRASKRLPLLSRPALITVCPATPGCSVNTGFSATGSKVRRRIRRRPASSRNSISSR